MTLLQTAISEFLSAQEADGLSPKTTRWYKVIVRKMFNSFGDIAIESITRSQLREYVVALRQAKERYTDSTQTPVQPGGYTADTLASYVTALHGFWSWVADEYKIENPMKAIKRPSRPAPEPKAIESTDFIKLFDGAAYLRDKAILAVLADTGCRIGGLMDMEIERLNLVQRRIRVTEKGKKSRTLFFTHFTAGILGEYISARRSGPIWLSERTGHPLTEHGVRMMLKNLKERTGVTGRVNPHAFRHGFAREYIKRGGDISTLAKLLGHADLSITSKYYAVFDEDELADFHDKFTPLSRVIDK